jgi:hypothetical protein
VSAFPVHFRLRPATSTRGEPSNAEVLLRAAIERYYPDLLRQEPARAPWVYFVVDERGNVLRHAVDWSVVPDVDMREAIRARFPDLVRTRDALAHASRDRVRTGIPGGRDIQVRWGVLRQSPPDQGPTAWGPLPLSAVANAGTPIDVVRRVVRERYPEVLQRGSEEMVWFIGYPDGEVVATGRGRLTGAAAEAMRRFDRGGAGLMTFEKAADGGTTQVYWMTPGDALPSDPNVITGTVRDAAGNPVAGAVVLLRDRQLGGATGADGRYAFRATGVPAGTHAIVARHPASDRAVTSQVTIQPGSSATTDLVLPAR